jgi:tetratricopeptide (TPR) repeat protein
LGGPGLGLLIESQAAELEKLESQYTVRRLDPFINRTRKVLNFEARSWDPETRAKLQLLLANALRVDGDQTGARQPLEEAIALFQETRKERSRERVPLDWAATQKNLGRALLRLGAREPGTLRLEAAVAAYPEALKEYTRERVPLDWADTQNDLGIALLDLGEREPGTARLEAAIAIFQEALKDRTFGRVPLIGPGPRTTWASHSTSSANASWHSALEAAVAAYQEALKVHTRKRDPLNWASTESNLGNALRDLGRREPDTVRVENYAKSRELFQEAANAGNAAASQRRFNSPVNSPV